MIRRLTMSSSITPRIVIEDLPELELLSEEQAAAIFGAGRVRLGIECLEARDLMSGFSLGDRVLTFSGTNNDNGIVVRVEANKLHVSLDGKAQAKTYDL